MAPTIAPGSIRVPLQPLQVGSHVRGVLVAQFAVFLQRLVDDVVPVRPARRDSAARAAVGARFRMASKMSAEVSPRNGSVPGRHLVQHRAEGKQIGARIQFLALGLLRRHVGHRAQRRPGTGQVLLARSCRLRVRCRNAGSTNCCSGVTFASPKSRILACPRLVTKMLAGLMSRWTMPSACAASSASAISMASESSVSISSGLAARCGASASRRPETPWR